jgi:hypothetical protein
MRIFLSDTLFQQPRGHVRHDYRAHAKHDAPFSTTTWLSRKHPPLSGITACILDTAQAFTQHFSSAVSRYPFSKTTPHRSNPPSFLETGNWKLVVFRSVLDMKGISPQFGGKRLIRSITISTVSRGELCRMTIV